jgi:rfaE bifunctional protein kinase chain/domain/rfaE bifunctional protein nucleotidyltransferase chain/domain
MHGEWVRRLPESDNRDGLETAREKILTLDQLSHRALLARKKGQRIALAHGTFDLLHMGHVRHLEQARALGDLLFVTITADAFVNKGPGRPVFPATLRAEMLAALTYVDSVAINDAPTAENVIGRIKPDVYVKGSDYAQAEDDITGKIEEERKTVEAHGGRIHFTYDITFSSSSLLNRHFDVFEPKLRSYLEATRSRWELDDFATIIDSIKDKSVLLIGDTIIDEYHYVSPLGKSPKENLIPTLYRSAEVFAGGVIAAANHVASFCRNVNVITCLGDDAEAESLVRSALKPNVELTVINRPAAPTTRKRRFVDSDYLRKMFEVYFMDDAPLTGAVEGGVIAEFAQRASQYDLVIATDFGHGMLTGKVRQELEARSRFLAVNAQSNSANHGFNLITKYRKADYICIDAPEARLAVGDSHAEMEIIAGELLPAHVDCSRLIVTHGRHGCLTYDRGKGIHHIPAFTGRAIDTMGAGDAFLAVTSPMVESGHDMEMIGFIGNAVGAIKVGIVGHRQSVDRIQLLKYLNTLLK